jgi:patatin-like phospholipase/acyl hydrolase
MEQQIGNLSDKCDLIAGTSTGGIIALELNF